MEADNYKPKGKELKVLKKIEQLLIALDKESHSSEVGIEIGIELNHALKGIRTNGREKVNSLYDVFCELQKEDDNLQDDARKTLIFAEKAAEFRLEVEALMEDFNICPICHGEKGEKIRGSRGISYEWEDCERCKGRGILENRIV